LYVPNQLLFNIWSSQICLCCDKSLLILQDLQSAVYENFPWQPASETNPTTKFLVPLVWSDKVLFHATLQLSSMRLRKAQSIQFDDHAKLLPGECIRLLRDRIESSGTTVGVSDGTISAVAALAGIEVIRLY
jgi:hypothetical protein